MGIPLRADSLRLRRRYARGVNRRELLADAGIAVGVLAVSLGLLAAGGSADDTRDLDPLGVLLAALASLPLAARRHAPPGAAGSRRERQWCDHVALLVLQRGP